ncbi:uncharacterized protein TRIVIDRAFT_198283 [Trichoderma virens Gv29-8]|uniref:Uncharacterized protein n=1 Tax=Hypocrea virens (strain Gv29-8 / FGSC 10586) TaxID=413071 RepID=G9MII9_HYPVG|nr:uncharacterized protein TRIVIDRAFT_198283 [Trichoderma virens Gv29-8]EHK25306.1 hypothetical protein TRIVIDRAFT_198283 [Trichoderma virens Gv29-8]UKZ48870.1 hypothetical protein TrVGV298_003106 [Trichoderma virens]
MDSDDEDCPRSVTHYGMLESRRDLKRRGFHPDVTSRTPSEVETDAIEYLTNKVNLPGRSQYIASQKALLGQGGGYGYRNRPRGTIIRRLTKGPWFVTATLAEKPAFKEAANRPKDVPADPKDALPIAPEIGAVTGHMYLGPKIMQDVFRDGHQTAMKLSLASSKMYKLVSDNVNRWDFCAMEYVVKVPSSVMVVVVPQHTVGDILEAQKRYKLQLNSPEWTAARQKLESQGDFDNYKLRSIEVEQTFFEWAQTWRIECLRAAGPYWVTKDGEIDPRTTDRAKEWWDEDKHAINVMGSLKPLDKMWSANQFEGTVYKLHKMPISLAMESLFKLMVELHRARSHVEVLHLHNVPLLDRRMLAIMLRGLPHVTMVGVYNCPLIHFGDVIPILDLIYEINQDRKEKNMPEIKAFDFFPCFNQGMPFAHKNAATYGISWEPIAMELAQPGFYGIILKAVMKSKGMGLDLLFSPDHAFMDYLVKVPNLPLGVYSFLDAVYRYLEVKRDDRNRCNLKLQAIYDMLKPIRIELDPYVADDWPRYYIREMGKTFLCCCSCGYATFREFFPAGSKRRALRHRQICCACLLQKALDDEEDHWKTRKKDLLDKLCPDWEPSAFNQDAPLFDGGGGLIRLESTETVRPRQDHPPFLVDGLLRLAPFWQALVRDQKRVYDSLAQLPSLEDVALDLATGRRWQDAVIFAIKEDVLRLGILELKSSYQHGVKRKSIPAYGTTRKDGGAPDHQDELQPPVFDEDWVFYDHKNALRLALWLKKRDW